MLTYPPINPIAIQLGPLAIHWYGLLYIVAFSIVWGLALLHNRRSGYGWTGNQLSDLVFYGALGAIIGGRLGYMVFYANRELLHHPWQLFKIWQGGMSFHGGFLGVMISLWMYSYTCKKDFIAMFDFVVPLVPLGLAVGRMGNFINSELWGRVSYVPWAMVYPGLDGLPRHPWPLYAIGLEGVLLFSILWNYACKPRPRFAVSAVFLLAYGLIRFVEEWWREPDFQLGYIAFDWLTMGQLLSLPMMLIGSLSLGWVYQRRSLSAVNKSF